jgi:hypothetical protein
VKAIIRDLRDYREEAGSGVVSKAAREGKEELGGCRKKRKKNRQRGGN